MKKGLYIIITTLLLYYILDLIVAPYLIYGAEILENKGD